MGEAILAACAGERPASFEEFSAAIGPQWIADALPPTLRALAVRVQRRGFRRYVVLTSSFDPTAYPAAEVAALYHACWGLELAFDELKNHTLERAETVRSQAPARVEQEVWGLLLGYNLVRALMARAAPHADVPRLRLSYWHAHLLLRAFRRSAWYLPPGTLPRHLDALLEQLTLLVIPDKRRSGRFSHALKIKMSNYPCKCPPRRPAACSFALRDRHCP